MNWNAVDADGTDVKITVETSDLGAVDAVIVSDNGNGDDPGTGSQGLWGARRVLEGVREGWSGKER